MSTSDSQYEVDTFSDETPVVRTTEKVREESPLQRLKTRVAESLKREPLVLVVGNVKGTSIQCNVDIKLVKMQSWQRAARVRNRHGRMEDDPVLFSSQVLCSQVEAIIIDGEVLKSASDDKPLRLTDPEFVKAIGLEPEIADFKQICITFFGTEADVMRYSDRLVEGAGYGSDEIMVDELGKRKDG